MVKCGSGSRAFGALRYLLTRLRLRQFKAIETPSVTDDRQWLTYWSIFGAVKIVEYFLNVLLYWVPYWFVIKTILFLWLALPQFRVCNMTTLVWNRVFLNQNKPFIAQGAEVLYGQYSRNIAGKQIPKIDTLKAKVASITKKQDSTSPKSPKSAKSQ